MAARRIVQLGDPLLRARSEPVRDGSEARAIFRDLRDTLHEFQRTHGFGRGISAIQIGEPKRLLYLEFEGSPYGLVNPEFESLSGEKFRMWDDCFSFPNLMVRLERSERCAVRYRDAHGEERRLEASGALAELLQHEMDHLDGVLAVDRALDRDSLMTREEWLRQGLATREAAPASNNV